MIFNFDGFSILFEIVRHILTIYRKTFTAKLQVMLINCFYANPVSTLCEGGLTFGVPSHEAPGQLTHGILCYLFRVHMQMREVGEVRLT